MVFNLSRLTLVHSVPVQKLAKAGNAHAHLAKPTAPGHAQTYKLTTVIAELVEQR